MQCGPPSRRGSRQHELPDSSGYRSHRFGRLCHLTKANNKSTLEKGRLGRLPGCLQTLGRSYSQSCAVGSSKAVGHCAMPSLREWTCHSRSQLPASVECRASQDLLVIRRNHQTGQVSLDSLRWGRHEADRLAGEARFSRAIRSALC
jgi:hypothetical protein